MRLRTHDAAATASAVALAHALNAVNNAGRGEVGRWNAFHEFVHRDIGVGKQHLAGRHHFREIMRRNVGGHTHGNTRGAIN